VPKYVAYPFLLERHCKELIAASQSADSVKCHAAILLTGGISFLLQFKQISRGMPISAISQ
jgi:hypothetical protein